MLWVLEKDFARLGRAGLKASVRDKENPSLLSGAEICRALENSCMLGRAAGKALASEAGTFQLRQR